MFISNIRQHIPEWVEATAIILAGLLVAYKFFAGLDQMGDKIDLLQGDVKEMKGIVSVIPLMQHQQNELTQSITTLEGRVRVNELNDAKEHQKAEDCCNGKER